MFVLFTKKCCIILTVIMFDCSVIMLRTNIISSSRDDHFVAFPLNYIKHCYETMTWLRTSSFSSNAGRIFCLDATVVDNFMSPLDRQQPFDAPLLLLLLFFWRFSCAASRVKTLFSCFSSRMKRTAFLLVFGVVLSFCEAQVSTSPAHMSWCFQFGFNKSHSQPRSKRVSLSFAKYKKHHLLLSWIHVRLDLFQTDTGGEETGGEEEHVELFTTPQTKMGAATSDFGYNLFRSLASRDASTNIFLAPISVSAALTQLSMGDKHTTNYIQHSLKACWRLAPGKHLSHRRK